MADENFNLKLADARASCVYMHTSPTGKSYIGQTLNYRERCRVHQKLSGHAFGAAVRKYGWNNFTHKVIVSGLTMEDANELEAFFIDWLSTLAPNGYNLRSGGDSSRHSEETKKRMSDARLGLKLSESTKAKVSASLLGNSRALGFKHTEATKSKSYGSKVGNSRALGSTRTEAEREQMSLSHIGLRNALGSTRTDEQKALMSAARRGNKSALGIRYTAEQKAAISAKKVLNGALRATTQLNLSRGPTLADYDKE